MMQITTTSFCNLSPTFFTVVFGRFSFQFRTLLVSYFSKNQQHSYYTHQLYHCHGGRLLSSRQRCVIKMNAESHHGLTSAVWVHVADNKPGTTADVVFRPYTLSSIKDK